MMVLSRIWYLVCAIAAALAFYAVSLAVGQFNRTMEEAMKEELKADTQVIGWALQLEARRHLDGFLLASSDDGVRKALKAAGTKEGFAAARVDAKKAIARVNERLPEDVRFDAAFVVDREGRVLGQVGFGQAESAPEMELGGFPAVFDSLRGFLRDDTWLLAGHVYRVSSRPVEDDDLTRPPLGAVVGLKEINDRFAQELAKKTRASVVFFNGDRKLGQAGSDEQLTTAVFDVASAEGAKLEADDFKEGSRTDFRGLTANKNEAAGAMFVRLPGEAGTLGASYGVLRRQATHGGPMDFITTATESDKGRVKRWLIAVLALGVALIGIALTFLEHARPLGAFRRQAAKLKKGEQDSFQLPHLAADYRAIGADVNGAIERIVEGRGGVVAKKPADLQSILGPVQPSMSAFSLPGSQGPASAPASVPPPAPVTAPASGNGPPVAKGGFAPPPPKGAPGPKGAAPPAPKLAPPPPKLVPPSALHLDDEDPSEEATRVGAVPEQVLAAAAQLRGDIAPSTPPVTPPAAAAAPGASPDPATLAEWRTVFEDFVSTKKQCGENVDGLTFEKFQTTLRKNRDALLQRHGTKRVKFSVYVKEGKAALKATPLKE